MRHPPTYVSVPGLRRTEAFALPAAVEWVASALSDGRTLHETALTRALAADDGEATTLRGRGPVPIMDVPDGRWVVRHYFRGGAMARLLHDRYLRTGTPRPASEARWAAEAARRGIPTPRVVAGAVYPAGVFYRADLVTEYVPRSRELADVLFGTGAGEDDASPDAGAALVQAARLVVQASEVGIYHPDLNARNILLSGDGDDLEPWLIDLDRCRFDVAGPDLVTGAMVRRLERSIRKIAAAEGLAVQAEWLETLQRGIREGGAPRKERPGSDRPGEDAGTGGEGPGGEGP